MGILADVFVATADDAERYEDWVSDGGDPPGDRVERVQYNGFTSLEFGTLWAILEGGEWDANRHVLETIRIPEGGETWLERFPDELVASLSRVSDAQLATAASAWGETEEIRCDGAELVPVMRDLRRLARSAIETKRGLYLWGSL